MTALFTVSQSKKGKKKRFLFLPFCPVCFSFYYLLISYSNLHPDRVCFVPDSIVSRIYSVYVSYISRICPVSI
jgi:hypothetical protein